MVATLLALLALAMQQAGAQAPELQVAARSASGAEQPEFAHAVSRALVVTGATVVLGIPGGEPCARCVAVTVIEEARGRYRLEARRARRVASGQVEVRADSTPFEKARALAVEIRLLARWPATDEPAPAEAAPEPARPEPVRAEPPRLEQAKLVSPTSHPSAAPLPEPDPAPENLAAAPADPAWAPQPPPPPPAEAAPVPAPEAGAPGPTTVVVDAPKTLAPPPAPAPAIEALKPEPRTLSQLWPWIPTAVGAASAIAAGGCALAAKGHYDSLVNKTVPLDRAQGARNDGKTLQTAGLVLTGVAAAALAAGIVGFVQGASTQAPPKVALGLVPVAAGGVAVGLSGRLP